MKPRESRSKEQDEMSAMWKEQTAKEYHNITTPAQRVHRMKEQTAKECHNITTPAQRVHQMKEQTAKE